MNPGPPVLEAMGTLPIGYRGGGVTVTEGVVLLLVVLLPLWMKSVCTKSKADVTDI